MQGTAGNGSRLAGVLIGFAIFLAAVVTAVAAPLPNDGNQLKSRLSFEIKPSKLSPTEPAPVWTEIATRYRTTDGSHPPPVKELRFQLDRQLALDLKGVPGCKLPTLGPRLHPGEIESICRKSIVGRGEIAVEVEFPDQPKTMVRGRIVYFRAVDSPAGIDLVARTLLTAPVTAEIATTVDIRRVSKGRIGWEALLSIPKIAGGAGSLTDYTLRIKRRFLSATCTDGRLAVRAVTTFADGQRSTAEAPRACRSSETRDRPSDARVEDNPPRLKFEVVPSTLPRTGSAPARMSVAGKYRLGEGSDHFEALQHLRFEVDRHLHLDLKGVPVCERLERDVRRTMEEMERLCGDAAIGRGQLTATGAFPGDRLISGTGNLTLYNRGRSPAGARLLAFGYLRAPLGGAFQFPVEIRRINRGRMGWEIRPEIPKNTGASFWITEYSLRIGKGFLSASCVGGKLALRVFSGFLDGTRRNERVARPCAVTKADVRQ